MKKPVISLKKPSAALLRRYAQVFPVGHAGPAIREVLRQRRAAHLEALDSFAVFSGVEREPGAENLWVMNGLKLFQEPALIHLTGINQPKVILFLNPKAKAAGEREILFIGRKDPKKEFWDGVRLGYPLEAPGAGRDSEAARMAGLKTDKKAGLKGGPKSGAAENSQEAAEDDLAVLRALTGIETVRPLEDFDSFFSGFLQEKKPAFGYAFYHRYPNPQAAASRPVKPFLETRTDQNWAFKERLEAIMRKSRVPCEIRTCAELHFRLRLPLDRFQEKDVDRAEKLTGEAFEAVLRDFDGISDENELAARIEYEMRRRSPFGLSFPSIVAAGRNATVLHYLKNDDRIEPGRLVLLDFGVRYGTMHADISRTVPKDGRFNPLQRLLYGIVLDAIKFNESRARPGETIRSLNKAVWAKVEELLEERFTKKGGIATRSYSGQPHGVSHLMGEQEHDGDPHRLYQDMPLQPGWQISNEPGLYGHFRLRLEGRLYSEWVGIRLEDNLLITEKGCRNLSLHIPKEIAQIEALMSR